MAKTPGPVPNAVKRRRNKDELAPMQQGTRRGITIEQPQPNPEWSVPVRNYFRAVLNSGQSDWLENSDLAVLTLQCVLLDRILRGSRTVVMYERDEKGNDVLDEDGNPVPMRDEYGEVQRMTIGSVNGQALKAALDLSASLLATEGDRRKLRIDLGMPVEDEVDQAALIAAEQRKTVGKVVPMRKTKKSS